MFKPLFENTAAPVSRLPWIDYAKGIAIILVVYRHIMIGLQRAGLEVNQYYVMANEVVFTFRMPLFFLLAGFFIRKSIGKRSIGEFISTKFNTILYPYLLWAFIQVTIQILISQYTNASRSFVDYLYILYKPRALDQFWYLYALFNTSLLYLFLFKVLKGSRIAIFGLALIFHYLSDFLNEIQLIHDALYYFLFLAVGDSIADFVLRESNKRLFSSSRLTLVLLPLFGFCQWLWFNYELNIFGLAIIALVGCAFIVNISFKLQNSNAFSWLRYVGFYSLYIYVLHVIVSGGVRTFLISVLGLSNTTILLITGIFFAVIIPIMF
jgi:fucose 4-O-acetylase-like acetyltransferase